MPTPAKRPTSSKRPMPSKRPTRSTLPTSASRGAVEARPPRPAGPPVMIREPEILPISPFGERHSPAFMRFGRLMSALRARLDRFTFRELSEEVVRLSNALSKSRSSTVRQDYLSEGLTRAAYCAHFLPWNICRLLLVWQQSKPRGLSLDGFRAKGSPTPVAPTGDNAQETTTSPPATFVIEDWGAGPMTALLALWVAGGLDGPRVRYIAIEKQAEMLKWGRSLLSDVGASELCSIDARAGELEFDVDDSDVLVTGRNSRPRGGCDLLIVSQAYNEWLPPRGRSDIAARSFARKALSALKAEGELLVMEPASRVASWGVMTLREVLLKMQQNVLAPCTHAGACPLLSSRLKAWCHFRVPVLVHPLHEPLIKLAGHERDWLSFSYLHSRAPAMGATKASTIVNVTESEAGQEPRRGTARILGDPIKLPDGRGVYACGDHGHLLLDTVAKNWPPELVAALPQGAVVKYRAAKPIRKDVKSGARRIWLAECRGIDGGKLGDGIAVLPRAKRKRDHDDAPAAPRGRQAPPSTDERKSAPQEGTDPTARPKPTQDRNPRAPARSPDKKPRWNRAPREDGGASKPAGTRPRGPAPSGPRPAGGRPAGGRPYGGKPPARPGGGARPRRPQGR